MKDMKKDEWIEEKIDSYVEGTSPNVDLSAAKRALSEEHARRRSARRKKWIAFASACASLLLVAIVLVGILPSFEAGRDGNNGSAEAPGQSPEGSPQRIAYQLSQAEQKAAGVGELIEGYGESLKKLTDLGLSADVGADYTLYYYDNRAVLLETDVLYSRLGSRVSATVYTDLSGGKYRAAELEKYDALSSKTSAYTYEIMFLNGEYVSLGAFSYLGNGYCVEVQSSYEYAFSEFMKYFV